MDKEQEEIIEYVYENLKQKSDKIPKELVKQIIEKSPMKTIDFFKETAFLVTDNPYDFESEAKEARNVKYEDDEGYLTVISQYVTTLYGDFVAGRIQRDYSKTNPEFSINEIQAVLVFCNSTTFKSDNIFEELGGYYGNTLYVYVPEREYGVNNFSDLLNKDNELKELISLNSELDAKIEKANKLLEEAENLNNIKEK